MSITREQMDAGVIRLAEKLNDKGYAPNTSELALIEMLNRELFGPRVNPTTEN